MKGFTFQTLDKDGLVLNMSQTWHQLRPGEMRNDCGGCHGHSQMPLDFDLTYAASPEYQIPDLTKSTPLLTKNAQGEADLRTAGDRAVDVEFHRDIKPILQRSCVGCHSESTEGGPAAQLRLDDDSTINGYDGTYTRLARDSGAEYGLKPVINNGLLLTASRPISASRASAFASATTLRPASSRPTGASRSRQRRPPARQVRRAPTPAATSCARRW